MNTQIRSCFVSAPVGTRLDVLQEALSRRGVRLVSPSLGAGDSWLESITSALNSADLVIGVLTRERRSDWTMFELGLAWGFGRRVLLLADPSARPQVPDGLRGLLVVHARPTNQEAVEFALDQLLAAPTRGNKPVHVPPRGKTLAAEADDYLEELADARRGQREDPLESVVRRALEASGVQAVPPKSPSERGADLAVWSDDLNPTVGNPVLVEIKRQIRTRSDAREVGSRFGAVVRSSGTRLGLLLFVEGLEAGEVQEILPPNIVALEIPVLLQRMRGQTFAEVVNDLRNRRTHGISG